MALTILHFAVENLLTRLRKVKEVTLVETELFGDDEDWVTDSDFSDSDYESDDLVNVEEDFLQNISEDALSDLDRDCDYILKISTDIFSCEIRTSFVNNRDSDQCDWFGAQLRHPDNELEEILHYNDNSNNSQDISDEDDSEDEDDNDESPELSSILQSWDRPQHDLWAAMRGCEVEEVTEALRNGASLHRVDPEDEDKTALLKAMTGCGCEKSQDILELLLMEGADLLVRNSRGETALTLAMAGDRHHTVGFILTAGGGDLYSMVK